MLICGARVWRWQLVRSFRSRKIPCFTNKIRFISAIIYLSQTAAAGCCLVTGALLEPVAGVNANVDYITEKFHFYGINLQIWNSVMHRGAV